MVFRYQYRMETPWLGRSYVKDIIFNNRDDAMSWQGQMLELKNHVSHIVATGRREQLPWENWLKACYTWINQWGTPRVPIDIRSSITEAEKKFGLPPTMFGPDVGAFFE